MFAAQPTSTSFTAPAPPKGRKLFFGKGQFATCHITVPDLEERLPAVIIAGRFYSFLKSVKDREKALDIVENLFDNGEDAIITQTPKAFSVWVLEPDAAPVKRRVRI